LFENRNKDESDIDEFIRRIKQYASAEVLDRAMALGLIDRITIDTRDVDVREIWIHYKLIG